jgi:hypothetical protein
MGISLGKALAKIFGNKEMRVLMLGLDGAGKTSKWIEKAFFKIECEPLWCGVVCFFSAVLSLRCCLHKLFFFFHFWFFFFGYSCFSL